jgi:hypothetical protein
VGLRNGLENKVANQIADFLAQSLMFLPITLARCVIITAGFGDGLCVLDADSPGKCFLLHLYFESEVKVRVNLPSASSEICRLNRTSCRPTISVSRHVWFVCPDLCSFLEITTMTSREEDRRGKGKAWRRP